MWINYSQWYVDIYIYSLVKIAMFWKIKFLELKYVRSQWYKQGGYFTT